MDSWQFLFYSIDDLPHYNFLLGFIPCRIKCWLALQPVGIIRLGLEIHKTVWVLFLLRTPLVPGSIGGVCSIIA